MRGNVKVNGGGLDWKLGLFRTDSEHDIIQTASVLQGRGVFQNVPGTRRQGLEAGAQYQAAPWLFYVNYALVDATYQFTGLLASPNNPSADANGNILVTPGNHIPGIPLHQIKTGVDYAVTPALKLGTDVTWVSSQWYVGDDANQNVKLPDYWVANLHGSYQLTKELQVYGLVNNLFNRKFATFGTYFDPQAIANALPTPLTDHRTITPAQPLSVYLGLRGKLDAAAPLVDKGFSPYKAPTLSSWTWAGPYLGGNVGHGWGKSNTSTVLSDTTVGTPLLAANTPGTLNGMSFGGQVGVNWQSGPWVIGIEGDAQQAQQRGRATTLYCAGAICNPAASASGLDAPVITSMAQRLQWFGTLRARLGATPTPDSLIYATGGLAVGRIGTSGTISGLGRSLTQSVTQNGNPVVVTDDVTPDAGNGGGGDDDNDNNSSSAGVPSVAPAFNPVSTTFTDHTTKIGWAIGAGAEVRLGGNWTGKIEYLYIDFGNVSASGSLPANLTPIAVEFNSHVTENLVRVGLNYKLDPFGVVYDAPKGLKGATRHKATTLPAWTWAGLYLGVNAGYGWGKSNTETTFSDAATGTPLLATITSAALKGASFGGQVGVNWQSGPWVMGIEGDAQQAQQRGQATTFNCSGAICNPAASAFGFDAPVTASMAQRLEWFRTLRARLGRTLTPDFMVYVTGGLAVGRIKTSGTINGSSLTVTQGVTPSVMPGVEHNVTEGVDSEGDDDEPVAAPVDVPINIPVNIPFVTASINPVSTQFTSHTTRAGWALGAGAEFRLGGNWTGKIEYLYLDFGKVSTTAGLPTNSTPLAINFNSHVTDNIMRVGVNYKFDPSALWANLLASR